MVGCLSSQLEGTCFGGQLAECQWVVIGLGWMVIGQTNQGETGPGLQRSQPGRPRRGLKAGMRAKEGEGYMVSYMVSLLEVAG